MPDVIYPALHGRQHCPGGEDPIPCLESGGLHFMYLDQAGLGFEHPDGLTLTKVEFNRVALSDGYSPYFDFDVVPMGGTITEDDLVVPYIKESGVYTFETLFHSSDLVAGDMLFRALMQPLDGVGTPCYPGQIGFPPSAGNIEVREQFTISSTGGDDLWLRRAWTIPLVHPNPGTPLETYMHFQYTNPGTGEFWTIQYMIIRHGDLPWSAANFSNSNFTWKLGDDYPS